jgi:hypothetical protein
MPSAESISCCVARPQATAKTANPIAMIKREARPRIEHSAESGRFGLKCGGEHTTRHAEKCLFGEVYATRYKGGDKTSWRKDIKKRTLTKR